MVTEKQEVVEQVVETQPAPPVEDIASIKAQLAAKEMELEQTKKGLSTAHQTLTQKDRQLKEQQDLRSDIGSIRQAVIDQNAIIELQAAAIALGREGNEEEIAKVNTLLRSKIAEQDNNRKQTEIRRQQEQRALASQEYNQKADVVFAQAQTLFEGDDLKDIEDLLLSGNLIMAQREVRLASKGKTPVTKVEPPKETDEARIAKGVQAELIRRGLLDSDTGSPSGGSEQAFTKERIASMSPQEFAKNRDAIIKAQMSDKIK